MLGIIIDMAIVAGLIAVIHSSVSVPKTSWRKFGRAVLAALGYLIVVGFVGILLVVLPAPSRVKQAVNASHIYGQILAKTLPVQDQLNHFLEHDVAPRLLTIEPKSETDSIALGFTVKSHKVRPDLEQKMLALVNKERANRGIQALTMNSGAQKVARAHSQDMFGRGYFSHYTPEGLSPFDRLHNGGVGYLSAGENLALAPNLIQAHNGLMNSPGHKANILDSSFNTVGIGIIDGGRYGIMVTQDFTN